MQSLSVLRNDLLTDPLGGSSLLNYINYNYKINQIKLFTNYAVEAGLTESNYSKTDYKWKRKKFS